MFPFLNGYLFRSCFPGRQSDQELANESHQAGKDVNCIFCYVTKDNGFNIVHEEDDLIVFHDRKAGSKLHLLCIPKKHILNVTTLVKSDTELVARLASVLSQKMTLLGTSPPDQQLGFHVPPFFSVNHIHMHGLSLPLNSPKPGIIPSKAKYNPRPPQTDQDRANPTPDMNEVAPQGKKVKSFSWFITARQAIQILNDGGKIGVVGYRGRGNDKAEG